MTERRERVCEKCGKELPDHARSEARFCSISCASSFKASLKRGEGRVYGVGKNDLPRATSYFDGKNTHRCPIYKTWSGMLRRCYSKSLHKCSPTYAGCSAAEEWHRFSAFEKWMSSQDWKNKHLDKDILVPGNKVYGPDRCVFVSRALNNFVNDRGSKRGGLPVGVSIDTRDGRYRACCGNPFTMRTETLGRFDSSAEASSAWRRRKHELACIYADLQTDKRLADALRSRYAI